MGKVTDRRVTVYAKVYGPDGRVLIEFNEVVLLGRADDMFYGVWDAWDEAYE